jgi:hypothetical protein
MLKMVVTAAVAVALVAAVAPLSVAGPKFVSTSRMAEASGSKEKAKPLSPQQQKRRDCAAKWPDQKAKTGVKGRKAYRKFLRECLRTTAT